jgi:GNAT superfamily N-acetyltransferase
MIRYAVETLNECLEELKPLLHKHYEEIAMYRDRIEFDPDYDAYYRLEEAGALHMVTVRDDGNIIGYYVSFIHHNLHYRQDKFAVNDILYVDEAYRGGTVAYKMLRYAEKALKDIGVSVMTIHMKTEFPFERLCEALGMDKAEYLYTKYIGD